MDIIGYVIVVIISIVVSPFIKGLVNKFVEEDKLEDAESIKNKGKEVKDKKKTKVKFVPEFDWKVTLVTVLAEIILFIYFKTLDPATAPFMLFSHLGMMIQYVVYAFFTLLLIICTFTDIKGCIIPNEINFVGFIVGIILTFINMSMKISNGINALAGMLVGLLVFLAIAGLSLLLFKKEGMGGGDIKLMGVIGLYLGLLNNIQVFILSFFVAAIISIFLLATKIKKGDDYIPFGPFIVIAAYITMLFPTSVTMPALFQLLG